MTLKLFLAILSLTFIFACSQSQNMVKQFDKDALKTEITKMNDMAAKAMIDGDYKSTLPNYTDDAISLPSYQSVVRGKEALKKNAEMQPPMKMNKFVLTSTDIWQEGKFIIDIGSYIFSMDMPQSPGGEFKDSGKYMTVYEVQKDGSLLIKAETWNTDQNPWMQMGQ